MQPKQSMSHSHSKYQTIDPSQKPPGGYDHYGSSVAHNTIAHTNLKDQLY